MSRSHLITSPQVPRLSMRALLLTGNIRESDRTGHFHVEIPIVNWFHLSPQRLPLSHQSPFKACPEYITLLCPSQPRPRGTGPGSILLNFYDYFPSPQRRLTCCSCFIFPLKMQKSGKITSRASIMAISQFHRDKPGVQGLFPRSSCSSLVG